VKGVPEGRSKRTSIFVAGLCRDTNINVKTRAWREHVLGLKKQASLENEGGGGRAEGTIVSSEGKKRDLGQAPTKHLQRIGRGGVGEG